MIGRTVFHYKITEEIGAGGMGVVYKAEDTKLKRSVALKFLSPHLTRDAEAKGRFIREAQAASSLDHPNICTIYEINETDDGQLFIVMAYYPGETLKEKIKDKSLKTKDAIHIANQIAQGLTKAHSEGIVHRDIKPANIIITNDGAVKILDFGLAKLTGQTKLTTHGTTLGTVAYMSPEQTHGSDVDHKTDVWSLGVVFYEMITGKEPFRGDYEQGVIYSVLNEEINDLEDLPGTCRPIITRCLKKNPDERYQNAEELANDLKQCDSENKPLVAEKPSKKPMRSVIGVGALALIALIIAGYFFIKLTPLAPDEKKQWINSIAVLPFDDLSQEKNQDYFCMGMTEQILTNLAKLNDLKVIARTSVMKYQNTQKTIGEIAEELDVRHILGGSIQREGEKIRINVQLINALTGAYLWSENYDNSIKDLFSVQDEVSQKVAHALNIRLKAGALKNEKEYGKTNTEAYEYCLKGEYISRYQILDKKLTDHFPLFYLAEEHFKKSLQLDSSFTRAKLGLAEHYLSYTFLHGDEKRLAQARDYANEVLISDPENSLAMALLGGYYYEMDEFDKAYIYLKKALQINPNDGKANYYMALLYNSKGLYNNSKKHLEKAVETDPLNTLYLFNCGQSFQNLGLYDEAAQYFDKLLEFNPDHVLGRWILIWNRLYAGKYDEAEKLFAEHSQKFPDFPLNKIAQARILAIKGEKEKALALEDSSVYNYLLLNMKDEGINRLIKEIDRGSSSSYSYLDLIHHPWFDEIRDDPRFINIVARQKAVYDNNILKYGTEE